MRTFVLMLLLFQAIIISQPTIYLVRHSEKINNWPKPFAQLTPLNELGIQTSKKLATYFAGKQLIAIFSSSTTRTMHTAYYSAKRQKLRIDNSRACSDTSLIKSFINEINEKYDDDESVLIVSHSNIIPYFLINSGLSKENYSEMNFTKSRGWWLTDYYGEVFIIEPNGKISRERFIL